jgi:hypothetical protein
MRGLYLERMILSNPCSYWSQTHDPLVVQDYSRYAAGPCGLYSVLCSTGPTHRISMYYGRLKKWNHLCYYVYTYFIYKINFKNQYVYFPTRDIFKEEILFCFEFSAACLPYWIVRRRPSLMNMSFTSSFETRNLRFYIAPEKHIQGGLSMVILELTLLVFFGIV